MKQKLYLWIEDYLFFPNVLQQTIAYLLLPLTFIYMLIILTKRTFSKEIDYKIPVISIGNIIVGGSGKTPIAIKLANSHADSCVILRGYGRASKGLYVISNKGEILEDINISGDEAMLLAKSLKNSTVIVSEDRSKAILKAKELGCKIIFLDDGFSKYKIKKFNILLRPKEEPTNFYCLPSGGYREPKGFYSYADLELQEGKDFSRIISIRRTAQDDKEVELSGKTVLLTAISKPKRLLEFLPEDTELLAYPDHYTFLESEINEIKEKYKEYNILTTGKDLVKLENFNIPNLYLMDLDIKIEETVDFSIMSEYIKSYE